MPGLTEKIRSFLKKPQNSVELTVDILCLAASYVLLFFMPQKVSILFWAVFALAAFLFCIGFFRLGFLIDKPGTPRGRAISGALLALLGVIINIIGFWSVYASGGTERGIATATLLMIEAMVMCAIPANHVESPRVKGILSVVLKVVAALMLVSAVFSVIKTDFSNAGIMLTGMLLIESVVLWRMSGSSIISSQISGICAVPGMKITVQQLCEALGKTETQLGYPWLGKIRTIREETIIYGPSEDGAFVYGYYHFGRFCMTVSRDLSLLDETEANAHKITEIPDSKGICLSSDMLPEAYANMMTRYLENGNKVWSTKLKTKKNAKMKKH